MNGAQSARTPLQSWPSSSGRRLRIDLYLHRIRLVKSRTLAQALIDTGYVRVDGKRIEKPSEQVDAGSVIALPLGGRVRVLKVLALPWRRGPAREARSHYEEVEPEPGN
jgi:ribosome-associated heat shock protein Hsp15